MMTYSENVLPSTNVPKPKGDLNRTFLRAARAGNYEKVINLLETGADINACNTNGLNGLHLASKEGHYEIVIELLKRGLNANIKSNKGNAPIHIASLAGKFEIIKILIENGASVNIQSQNGFTPLYMAAQENHLECVRLLLDHNANPSITTDDGFTPLAVAIQQGHDRTVALLLENHSSGGEGCLPALHIAAKKDDVKAASLLLNGDISVDNQSASGFTPLHIAAHYGNVNVAQLLINRGANVNFQAKNNITPLHVASKWGNTNVVDLLIKSGVEINCRTRDGLSPLHCSARSGHVSTTKLLLSFDINRKLKTRNGLTPIHMAAQGDHPDVAQILIKHGFYVDDITVDYLTPLHVASHCGNLKVAKVLILSGCDVDARAMNGFTPLHIACKKNRLRIAELLLKNGCTIEASTETGLTPLHVACFMGHVSIVLLLVQHGANPNSPTRRQETAIHLATRAGLEDIVRLLLRNGADVNARARGGISPLHIASKMGHADLISILIQHGADVNLPAGDSYTPLHLAAMDDHCEAVRTLLDNQAPVDIKTKSGFTPLHITAKHGHLNSARILLTYGKADINSEGRNNLTPLHLACHYGSEEMVQEFLKYKPNINCVAKNGYSPLHICASKGYFDIVKILLDANARSDILSINNCTPLHLCALQGNPEVARLLLTQGNCDPNAATKNGLTPMHLAAQEDKVQVAQILKDFDARLNDQTKAGYTPLHTACHFGQVNMVKFLIGSGAQINQTTHLDSNALHLAAQQGHSQIVYMILDSGCDPNVRNKYNWTPAHIAKKQHYLNIYEVLREVTTIVEDWEYETVTMMNQIKMLQKGQTNNLLDGQLCSQENKEIHLDFKNRLNAGVEFERPDLIADNPITDTEEEIQNQEYTIMPSSPMFSRGSKNVESERTEQNVLEDITLLSNNPIKRSNDNLTKNAKETIICSDFDDILFTSRSPKKKTKEGKSKKDDKKSIVSGEDSIHESSLVGSQFGLNIKENVKNLMLCNELRFTNLSTSDITNFVPYHDTDMKSNQSIIDWNLIADNVPIERNPITSGFLVSFLVDARGGTMKGSRHNGLRLLVPPSSVSAPTRITCRMLRPERTAKPPQLNDSEGLACRILELGPYPCIFNKPVLLEVPHYVSLQGRQRELVILRSENGETWKEHSLEANDIVIKSALGSSLDNLNWTDDAKDKRSIKIILNDIPLYLAIISRLRQETALIDSDGGVLSSTVVAQVQAVFPEGALQKRIRVGLQAQPISQELVNQIAGISHGVTVSPIVTLEPRRRKFHKPITLTIPLPKGSLQSNSLKSSGRNSDSLQKNSRPLTTLRLMCSISGGTTPAYWEDITGSTPLSRVKDCVSFTTTLSARFWLMETKSVYETSELANLIYRESCLVPYMSKFVVFGKRCHRSDEALIRCFSLTDDKVDKTLECQEGFEICAASPEVEMMNGMSVVLEIVGSHLKPMIKSKETLRLEFNAFRENRLAFPIRISESELNNDPIVGKFVFLLDNFKFLRQNENDIHGNKESVFIPSLANGSTPLINLSVTLPSEITSLSMNGRTNMASIFNSDPEIIGDYNSQFNNSSTMSQHDLMNGSTSPQLKKSVKPCSLAASQSSLNTSHSIIKSAMYDPKGRQASTPAPEWATVLSHQAIAKTHLDLIELASEITSDWPRLLQVLFDNHENTPSAMLSNEQLPDWVAKLRKTNDKIPHVTIDEMMTDKDRALLTLITWQAEYGEMATGNLLDNALRKIGREDVVKNCMRDIQHVFTRDEIISANNQIESSAEGMKINKSYSINQSLNDTSKILSESEDRLNEEADFKGHLDVNIEKDLQSDYVPAQEEEIFEKTLSSNQNDPLLKKIDYLELDILRDSDSMQNITNYEDEDFYKERPQSNYVHEPISPKTIKIDSEDTEINDCEIKVDGDFANEKESVEGKELVNTYSESTEQKCDDENLKHYHTTQDSAHVPLQDTHEGQC